MIKSLTGLERIYRLLLHLCPAEFRQDYGRDMLELFRDCWRMEQTGATQWSRFRLCRRLLVDLLCTASILRSEVFWKGGRKRGTGTGSSGHSGARPSPNPVDLNPWSGTLQDLRSALRSLVRNPGATAIILLTLTLGIGVNVAIFGVIDRILLSPPPHIEDPPAVVRVQFEWNDQARGSFVSSTTSFPLFRLLRESGVFRRLAAESNEEMAFQRPQGAIQVAVAKVSEDYFALLGTTPLIGVFWGDASAQEAVAVLSHAFWQNELGGSREVLGSDFRLNGELFSVIGVAPAGFSGAGVGQVDLWVPIMPGMRARPAGWHLNSALRIVKLIARLEGTRNPLTSAEKASQALSESGFGPARMKSRIVLTSILPGRSAGEPSPLGRLAF